MSFIQTTNVEKEILQPEISNTYKVNNQEVIVLTGSNPKCPPGYKIVKTNINQKESDTKVVVCVKGDGNLCDKDPKKTLLDYNDPLSLAVTDSEYKKQVFAFGKRSDAFIDEDDDEEENICYSSAEIWVLLFIFLIMLSVFINSFEEKKLELITKEKVVNE